MPCFFEHLHPACRVISGVEVQKGDMRARVRTFILGFPPSQFYEFGHKKEGILKIMH
jgi:hypothetical protein